MSKHKLLHVFVLIVLFISSSFMAMGKNPVLKNSKWTAVQEIFVADAGTMTITHTLEFTSGKEVKILEKSHMPDHPAMYMNPDGTVDRIPGYTSESSEAGTYSYRRGILTITTEDGNEALYFYQKDGTFTTSHPWGEILVYTRIQE